MSSEQPKVTPPRTPKADPNRPRWVRVRQSDGTYVTVRYDPGA